MATILKQPVILYFINGSLPSEGDKKAAEKLNGTARVVYRNAHHVNPEDAIELCDGVSGAVPPVYKNRFPTADEAIANYEKAKKSLSDKVGDEPAPVVKPTNVESVSDVTVKETKTTENKAASVWKGGK